jgi:hypothetical protein
VPPLGIDLLWGNPHALTAVSLLSVVVWIVMHIRGVHTVFPAMITLLLIGGYIGFEFAGAAIQVIPAGLVFIAAAVASSNSASERRIKIAVLAVVAAALGILLGRFLTGLYLDTKGAIFPHEMFARSLTHLRQCDLLNS